MEWNLGLGGQLYYIYRVFLARSVHDHCAVNQYTCRKMVHNSKTAGRIAKVSEIWDLASTTAHTIYLRPFMSCLDHLVQVSQNYPLFENGWPQRKKEWYFWCSGILVWYVWIIFDMVVFKVMLGFFGALVLKKNEI